MSPTAGLSASPISDALKVNLDKVLAQIPSGKRGTVTLGVTKAGAEVGIGIRKPLNARVDFTASGYAGKLWGGGWDAGARAAILW